MRKVRDTDKIVVQKMIEYCNKIEILKNRFGVEMENYIEDFAFQMSSDMCILQIGELTARLTEDFKAQHSEIEWKKIKNLRNIHVHEYEKIDYALMWEILTEDIPALKKSLQKIFEVI